MTMMLGVLSFDPNVQIVLFVEDFWMLTKACVIILFIAGLHLIEPLLRFLILSWIQCFLFHFKSPLGSSPEVMGFNVMGSGGFHNENSNGGMHVDVCGWQSHTLTRMCRRICCKGGHPRRFVSLRGLFCYITRLGPCFGDGKWYLNTCRSLNGLHETMPDLTHVTPDEDVHVWVSHSPNLWVSCRRWTVTGMLSINMMYLCFYTFYFLPGLWRRYHGIISGAQQKGRAQLAFWSTHYGPDSSGNLDVSQACPLDTAKLLRRSKPTAWWMPILRSNYRHCSFFQYTSTTQLHVVTVHVPRVYRVGFWLQFHTFLWEGFWGAHVARPALSRCLWRGFY